MTVRFVLIFLVFLYLAFFLVATETQERSTFLRCPDAARQTDLPKNLQIHQNDHILPIKNWVLETASLSQTATIVPKTLILELRSAEYSEKIDQFVTHLISDLTLPGDVLLIAGYQTLHPMVIGPDKLAIFDQIKAVLTREADLFKKKGAIRNQQINNAIQQLNRAISGVEATMGFGYGPVQNFMQTVPNLVFTFISEDLFLNAQRLEQAFNSIALPPGDRWWMRIEDCRAYDSLQRLPLMLRIMRGLLTSSELAAKTLPAQIEHLRNTMEGVAKHDNSRLIASLQAHNCRYVTLQINNEASREEEGSEQGPIMTITSQNQQISKQCGGFSTLCSNLDTAYDGLLDYQDRYWKLFWPENIPLSESELHISADLPCFGGLSALTTKQELAVDYDEIAESDPEHFYFTIKGFVKDKQNTKGLISVQFQLLGAQGEILLKSKQTLHSSENQFRISIPLPMPLGPTLSTQLQVYDHVAAQFIQNLTGPFYAVAQKK